MNKLLLITLSICFISGCSNNKTMPIEAKSENIVIDKNVSKKPKINKIIKRSLKKEPTHPIEVARVCFDKQGEAHNCNYKIKKPYLDTNYR